MNPTARALFTIKVIQWRIAREDPEMITSSKYDHSYFSDYGVMSQEELNRVATRVNTFFSSVPLPYRVGVSMGEFIPGESKLYPQKQLYLIHHEMLVAILLALNEEYDDSFGPVDDFLEAVKAVLSGPTVSAPVDISVRMGHDRLLRA